MSKASLCWMAIRPFSAKNKVIISYMASRCKLFGVSGLWTQEMGGGKGRGRIFCMPDSLSFLSNRILLHESQYLYCRNFKGKALHRKQSGCVKKCMETKIGSWTQFCRSLKTVICMKKWGIARREKQRSLTKDSH